jgi:hypothetical protein
LYDPRQLELALPVRASAASHVERLKRELIDDECSFADAAAAEHVRRVDELREELQELERHQHERDGHVHARPYKRGDPTE